MSKSSDALKAKYGSNYFKTLGSNGGKETVKRHGTQHMREIGRAGFTAAMASFANNPYLLNKMLQKEGKWSHLKGAKIGNTSRQRHR